MLHLRIGSKFPDGIPKSELVASLSGSPVVIYTSDDLSETDVDNFTNGIISLGVTYNFNLISFLLKIKGFCKWSDTAYHPVVDVFESKSKPKTIDQVIKESKIMTLILVERTTHIIKAIRLTNLPILFCAELEGLISKQTHNISLEEYILTALEISSRYKIDDLVNQAKTFNT
jgi:hypothetical protein